MNNYDFKLTFYDTFGTFRIEANNIDEAYEKARQEIMESIKDLPVEVEFDYECVYDDEEEDEEEEE